MFTVSSNKPLDICLLGDEAGKEMWPEERTEHESGLPSGGGHGLPALGTPHRPAVPPAANRKVPTAFTGRDEYKTTIYCFFQFSASDRV